VISTSFFISKVKRKKSSIIGMGMASLFCFILAALSLLEGTGENDAVKLASTIGLMIGRFFIMSFWAIFYVYLAEMYPTRVRSLGFGWASAMGTVGSTSSPYIILFSENIGLNTWVIPGITGIISVISLFFLKETFGKPLQDEI
jgi:MFS family permease